MMQLDTTTLILICVDAALLLTLIVLCALIVTVLLVRRRRRRLRSRAYRRKVIGRVDHNHEYSFFNVNQFKQMGPIKICKKLKLPKRSQPDKPVAIRPGRELKLMKSDCKVYEVGSYVEICLDEFGKPVDEQSVVTPPTPPSTSAYEEDIETYSHVDESQESIVTVPPEAGMASMQSIESPTDMLSGDDDRSQQSPSVMTPNTSIMTPNTSLVAPTKSLMSKAEEEDIYAVE